MKNKIIVFLVMFSLFYISLAEAQIAPSCQNFPLPSFCPGGINDVFVTGTSPNGCATYGCKSQIPSVKVISPNGGEEWQIGKAYDISWESANVDNVNIYLEFPDGYLCLLKTEQASKGNYLFNFLGGYQCSDGRVPHSEPNNNYKMTILGDTQAINDSSDDYFYIMYSPNQPTVTVVSPNGGEQWIVGRTYNIVWNTTLYDTSGLVDLQLCDTSALDGRGLCAQITNPLISNSGSYIWTVPPNLGGMKIGGEGIYQIESRIWPEGLTRWARIDFSNNNFSIAKPISIITPKRSGSTAVCPKCSYTGIKTAKKK